MKKPLHAFTLIELLTVIAIIGILAAILIPVVGAVRDSARQAKCMSNIRETGNSLYLFIDSSEFRLATHGEGNNQADIWSNQLWEAGFLDAREVAYCPTMDHGLGEDPFQTNTWMWRTYGLNMFDTEHGQFSQVFGQPGRRWGINYNLVEEPSRYILLAESVDSRDFPRFRIDSRSSGGDGSIHLRHNRKAMVSFLDGHVEACGPERLGNLGMISGHGATYDEVMTFPVP